jgi:hypothetical protein
MTWCLAPCTIQDFFFQIKDAVGYCLFMNTASQLGPHTQTNRGTCPGVALSLLRKPLKNSI